MFENLNPIFSNKQHQKGEKDLSVQPIPTIKKSTSRSPRSDKLHQIKFPVSTSHVIAFKTSIKRFLMHYPEIKLTQTKYNTLLLQYALDNPSIVNWNQDYIGTSDKHMTTKLKIARYNEIGGINGISVEKGISERKAAYMMTLSALYDIEKREGYYEILQQTRDFKK